MGFRFRKSANIGPLRVNFSKSGVGYSVGGKGFRVTKRADGKTQTTASVPGTGIAYTKVSGSGSGKSSGSTSSSGGASGRKKKPVGPIVLAVLLLLGLIGCISSGNTSSESAPEEKEAASVQAEAATEKMPEESPVEVSNEPDSSPEDTVGELPDEPAETPAEAPQQQPDAPKVETPAEPEKNDAAPVVTPPAAVEAEPAKETPAKEAPAPVPQSNPVIGNRNSKIYHEPGCSSVNDMSEKNKVNFDSAEAAKSSGYKPCSRCH